MRNINFAISLGSNITSIYKRCVGVVLSDRSAVVVGGNSKKQSTLYVGYDAVTSGLKYDNVIENGNINFDLARLLLAEFFKKIEITKKDGVVFLVALEQMALTKEFKNLGYSLGINTVEVIPSIIATTYGFEIENYRKSFLLCDIGVNTEIAIVNNGRIVTGATVKNGGSNIDENIKKYIFDSKGIELKIETAENVKNELATLLPHDERSMIINGFIKGTTEYSSVEVSSSEIFGIVVEEYSAIASAILKVLSSCNNEINSDISKHGIYLCGASSKIVGLEKFLKLKLNLTSYVYKPDSVTMVGAGQLLDGQNDLQKVIAENSIF